MAADAGKVNYKKVVVVSLIVIAAIILACLSHPRIDTISHTGDECVAFHPPGSDYASGENNATGLLDDADEKPAHTYAIGVVLSILADIIIAIGLTIEKRAHMDAQAQGKADGVGTTGFYIGIILKNVVGEIGNLLAYAFAPASVVAPVGTVSVVANEILAVRFLGEPCRRRDWIALVLVIVGIVLIVVSVPEADVQLNVHELLSTDFYFAPRAYFYCLAIIPLIGIFVAILQPLYALKYIWVWLFLCSLISSITVIAARGFASLLTQAFPDCFNGETTCDHGVLHPPCTRTLGHWLFWALLLVIAITGIWSEYYRVKATENFDNTQVLPVYQCFFTIFSVLGGMCVYNEFKHITVSQAIRFFLGMLLSIGGVLVLLYRGEEESKAQSPPRGSGSTSETPSLVRNSSCGAELSSVAEQGAGAPSVGAVLEAGMAVDSSSAAEIDIVISNTRSGQGSPPSGGSGSGDFTKRLSNGQGGRRSPASTVGSVSVAPTAGGAEERRASVGGSAKDLRGGGGGSRLDRKAVSSPNVLTPHKTGLLRRGSKQGGETSDEQKKHRRRPSSPSATLLSDDEGPSDQVEASGGSERSDDGSQGGGSAGMAKRKLSLTRGEHSSGSGGVSATTGAGPVAGAVEIAGAVGSVASTVVGTVAGSVAKTGAGAVARAKIRPLSEGKGKSSFKRLGSSDRLSSIESSAIGVEEALAEDEYGDSLRSEDDDGTGGLISRERSRSEAGGSAQTSLRERSRSEGGGNEGSFMQNLRGRSLSRDEGSQPTSPKGLDPVDTDTAGGGNSNLTSPGSQGTSPDERRRQQGPPEVSFKIDDEDIVD